MSQPYTPTPNHVVCVNCKGPIPSYRHGMYATCTRSCSLANLGLWSGFNPGNQHHLDHAATVLVNNYRVLMYPERTQR